MQPTTRQGEEQNLIYNARAGSAFNKNLANLKTGSVHGSVLSRPISTRHANGSKAVSNFTKSIAKVHYSSSSKNLIPSGVNA